MNKTFNPSKTAINSLNFISKEEESNITKKEQTEEVYNILRLLYIILNEGYQDTPSIKLAERLYMEIFPKYKVDNMSILLCN